MRQTLKYSHAIRKAAQLGLPTNGTQDDVYDLLIDAGWMWDSDTGSWMLAPAADPPTDELLIRVWAAKDAVEDEAIEIVDHLRAAGLKLIERSRVYPCRPPKQLEARVYLKFQLGAQRQKAK